MTYGALVAQLVRDYETDDEINKQLDKMSGINMMRHVLLVYVLSITPLMGLCIMTFLVRTLTSFKVD